MIAFLLSTFLMVLPQGEADFSFNHKDSLQVVVIAAGGEPIPGVTLALCPYDGRALEMAGSERCAHQITDAEGQAGFQSIESGEYAVTGVLEGFASAAIYPLSIKSSDPIAPDRVFLLLNPVCFDC